MSALPPGLSIQDDILNCSSSARIDEAAARAAAMQAYHLLPLLHAARHSRLAFVSIHAADAEFPTKRLENIKRAVVVLVGDDPWPHGESVGPSQWESARRLRYWAPQAVVVHGTGPHPDHYRMAVDLAAGLSRIAFIETESARIDEWAAFLGCLNTIRIMPPPGCVHPAKSTETLQ